MNFATNVPQSLTVENAKRSGRCEAFVNLRTRLIIHLLGAIEHIHHDTEGSPQIFRCLRFTGSSWARRCARINQMQRLSERK